MGYLIKNLKNNFVSFETIVLSKDLLTMGSIPVPINSYDNSQSAITNKIFIPISCSLRQSQATIPYDFAASDHIIIQYNPGTYFFYKDNILRATNLFVYTSLYYQQTHNIGGVSIITNYDADKLGGNTTITTRTGNDATTGDGNLLVSIGGYLMDV